MTNWYKVQFLCICRIQAHMVCVEAVEAPKHQDIVLLYCPILDEIVSRPAGEQKDWQKLQDGQSREKFIIGILKKEIIHK